MLQSGVDGCPVMEGWSVEEEEELNKLTTEPVTMGHTALARHRSLIEMQMRNIIKNMSKDKRDKLKQKLEEADGLLNIVDMVSILRPPQVCKTQDNLEDPEGGEYSNMLEAAM